LSQEQKKITASESRALLAPTFRAMAGEPVYMNELLASGYYDIAPPTLRPPQLPTFSESLNDSGDNLASVLRQLCSYEDVKQELLTPLRSVVAGVSDIRVQRVGGYWVTELKHDDVAATNGNTPWFELNRESDGTLRWLALLVALHQRTLPQMVAPRLVALEEPETSLHPGALAIIADELYAARERFQLLVTTQSPDLIARLNAEDLRVVERVNGATQIGPLAGMQRETIAEQLFTAGDLLRIEGLRRETAGVARA
jgi:predicted ATPase